MFITFDLILNNDNLSISHEIITKFTNSRIHVVIYLFIFMFLKIINFLILQIKQSKPKIIKTKFFLINVFLFSIFNQNKQTKKAKIYLKIN